MSLGPVVVTGAAGRIGTVVRRVRDEISRLIPLDRREVMVESEVEEAFGAAGP